MTDASPAPRTLLLLRRLTRVLAGIRGMRRITRAVRRHYSGRSDVIRLTDVDGDLRFDCHLDSHISGQIFWDGAYSLHQLKLLGRWLEPDHVFLDIGANEGEQTVFAAKRLTRGRVIAFEPSSEIRARLVANVEANGFRNVTLEPVALSDAPGELPLYRTTQRAADGAYNEGKGTLFPREDAGELAEVVSVTTLDAYAATAGLQRVDVMKMDVEGAEYSVIRGGAQTIDRHRPLMILEVSDETCRAAGHSAEELLELVRAHGYAIRNIDRAGRVEVPRGSWTLDMLAIPNEKLALVEAQLNGTRRAR